METQDLLKARFDTLIRRMEQAEKSVRAAGLNARLNKRIGAGLSQRLSSQLTDLRKRRSQITSSQIPQTVWSAFGEHRELDLLFDECLMFIQAARSRGPDDFPDLCEITDQLFVELAGKMNSTEWRSYTTFSSEDSFDGTTDIVRLRYPLCDIWDLPVTVHEFGHFMSPRLIHKTPTGSTLALQEYKQQLLARVNQQQQPNEPKYIPDSDGVDWLTYADEMFADAFATYALGPAFACTCITLRFDPLQAQTEVDGRHPSYARRSYIILQTLKRMDQEPEQRFHMRDAIQFLEKRWNQLCAAARVDAAPDEKNRPWLDAELFNIYAVLRSSEPGLRFSSWKGAVQQQACLLKPSSAGGNDVSIAQLLNTAWILRMTPACDPEELNRNFLALFQSRDQKYDG